VRLKGTFSPNIHITYSSLFLLLSMIFDKRYLKSAWAIEKKKGMICPFAEKKNQPENPPFVFIHLTN
jgi:hypothetical protein